jgi:hypothetical protein
MKTKTRSRAGDIAAGGGQSRERGLSRQLNWSLTPVGFRVRGVDGRSF